MGNLKATDLRIGNLVKYRWATIKVISIDLDGINLKHDYNKYACEDQVVARIRFRNPLLTPIKITDTFLLKLGFEKYREFLNGKYLRMPLGKDSWLYWRNGIAYIDRKGYSCEYLHELQNLIYSLTKKELEVEL